jgi:hypothetical protein
VLLLKLCWDGGKDEMATCVSKNTLEASTCICSARFDGGEIFIEFVIRLKNNAFACFSLVPLTVSMCDTCVCIFNDTACLSREGSTINRCGLKFGEKTFCSFETLLCIVELF